MKKNDGLVHKLELSIKKYNDFLELNFDITDLIDGGLEPNYEHPDIKKYYKNKNRLFQNLRNELLKLFDLYETSNNYFFDCSLDLYKNTFNERLHQFLSTFKKADKINFIKEELNNHFHPEQNRKINLKEGVTYNYSKVVDKIIDFNQLLDRKIRHLQTLLNNPELIETIETSTQIKLDKKKLTSHPIFKDSIGEELFKKLIAYLDISETTIKERGTQAKFHAIWENNSAKDLIFKPTIRLLDYINYLNTLFKTNYNSRSFSEGSRYKILIKNWFSST